MVRHQNRRSQVKKKTAAIKPKRKPFLVDMPPDLRERLKEYARGEERSSAYVVRHAVVEYLERHAK
jgi:predicted DNA-binding protein